MLGRSTRQCGKGTLAFCSLLAFWLTPMSTFSFFFFFYFLLLWLWYVHVCAHLGACIYTPLVQFFNTEHRNQEIPEGGLQTLLHTPKQRCRLLMFSFICNRKKFKLVCGFEEPRASPWSLYVLFLMKNQILVAGDRCTVTMTAGREHWMAPWPSCTMAAFASGCSTPRMFPPCPKHRLFISSPFLLC